MLYCLHQNIISMKPISPLHQNQQIQQKQQKLLCDRCVRYFPQSIYIAHWNRCKINYCVIKCPFQKNYPTTIIEMIKHKQENGEKQQKQQKQQQRWLTKYKYSEQAKPNKQTKKQQNKEQESETIMCTYCGYMMNLNELDSHPYNCQNRGGECQYCNELFPIQFMLQHHQVCTAKPLQLDHHHINQNIQHLSDIEILMMLFETLKKKDNGLTQQERNKLKIHKLKQLTKQQQKCTVCMQVLTFQTQIIMLYCKHIYHPDCIKAWLQQHSTCPNCKWSLKQQKQLN